MVTGLIPHRYAKALYKYAGETDSTARLYGEMKTVIASFAMNPELDKVLDNPYVREEDKRKLLLGAAGADDEVFSRFVTLVIDHRRENLFRLMAYAYRDIYRKANRISQVKITTAVEFPEEEMERLRRIVESSYRDRKFEYEYAVNPDLIGGFMIDVDSTRMDASINGELEQLRQNLLTGN